jgi:hypothetical protein
MNAKPHSGEVVNLRMARKRKARKHAEATASVRRVAFGLSKPEKRLADAQRDLAAREHEAHRIVPISGDAE